MRYRVVLFDLFGTIVLFAPDVPVVPAAGEPHRSTMGWLEAKVREELPDVAFEDFRAAMGTVTEEIVRARVPDYREVQSVDRFRRTLESLGYRGPQPLAVAERLSLAHMAHLAERTQMPAAHGALLRELLPKVAIGLVSNFDHAPTALSILQRERIADLFPVKIISAEFGRRKPHPSIFEAALQRLGAVPPEQALFVGDSLADDVRGGHAAGIDVAWVNPGGVQVPSDLPAPRYQIRHLSELLALLELR